VVAHIVIFTWIADAAEAQIAALGEALAGLDAFQAHPSHKAFVRDFVTPLQANRLTLQF
jgi:hypothetical protein